VREVRAHWAHDEPLGGSVAGVAISIEALGDFEATTLTAETEKDDVHGVPLEFPAATRAVSARAEGNNLSWTGIDQAGAGDHIDCLLWRQQDATPLWPWHELSNGIPVPIDPNTYPREARGVSVGYLARHRLALFVGSMNADPTVLALDVSTGAAETASWPTDTASARGYATVTPFGQDALLVAGGVSGSQYLYDAEIFDANTSSFESESVLFKDQRAHHGAVLLASGETLLVGGEASNGPLDSLEAISPTTRSARSLGHLERARIDPIVLRLSDQRIFIGGGHDAAGPVSSLEWRSSDASTTVVIQQNVVLAEHHAFAAMPGGSVLGVGVCAGTGATCPTGDALSREVTWVQSNGTTDRVAPLDFTPTAVWLVPASDASPWLVARNGVQAEHRRFNPWSRSFEAPDAAPETGPDANFPAPVGIDPGAFVWIETSAEGPRIAGFRHDTRGSYARDLAPLLFSGPEHVAPNRAPFGLLESDVEYTSAGLDLRGPDSLAVVADTSYADFSATIELGGAVPPVLVVGGQRVGGAFCPWPEGSSVSCSLVRRGKSAVLERDGKQTHCAVPGGRVDLGLSAESAATRVRSLEIRRQ
jgi:hypothetical protein